jgi:hypothetical protein
MKLKSTANLHHSGATVGALLMLASAFLFAVLDGLIKLLGPPFRIWDIAFYRFACGLAILVLIMGRNFLCFSRTCYRDSPDPHFHRFSPFLFFSSFRRLLLALIF